MKEVAMSGKASSGGAPAVDTPPNDGEALISWGGVGGQVAFTEDLCVAVTALRSAADALCAAVFEARGTQLDLVDVSALGLDASPAAAVAAGDLWTLTYGTGGVKEQSECILDMQTRLRETVTAMEQAEHASDRGMSLIQQLIEAQKDVVGFGKDAVHGVVGGAMWIGSRLNPWVPNLDSKTFLPGAPETTGYVNSGTFDRVGNAWSAVDPAITAANRARWAGLLANLAAIAEKLAKEPPIVSMDVTDHIDAITTMSEPPHSATELMDQAVDVSALGDGTVAIETLNGPNGPAYIIVIPHTQDDWITDSNPFDFPGAAALIEGELSDSAKVVVAAMEAAGIPPGAPVMFVGHSQGGIVAGLLASSPAMQDKYTITHVETAGSPVAGFAMDGVRGLHVEHFEDIVTGLDIESNPDTPWRTTVVRTLTLSPDPEVRDAAQTIVGAHEPNLYRDTMYLVENSGNASVDAFVDSASPFLTATSVETTFYTPEPAHKSVIVGQPID